MIQQILFFLHGALLLIFGVNISASYAGVALTKKNIAICMALCVFSGALQSGAYLAFPEAVVWKLYPVITHIPLLLLLVLYYRKRVATAVAAVTTAYLCCQPAKWFGLLVYYITASSLAEYIARIVTICVVAAIAFCFLSDSVAEIFGKDSRSVWIFGIIPVVYYLFDYATVVYTDFFTIDNQVAVEFLPFFLCVVFMMFCLIYYREYEQKSDAERKEQIVRIIVDEQKREIEAVRRTEQEIRILRHDMRLLLNSVLVSMDNGDSHTARKLISSYVDNVDATAVKRYCSNTTINYILSSYSHRCSEQDTEFVCHVDAELTGCDEIMLSSIISNALDNALNAQKSLHTGRKISLMLKENNGKLLMSVINPFAEQPVFADGLPLSGKKGHGYGTQSIVYLTERMGGNCQFTTTGSNFVLRVIIPVKYS